MDYRLTDLIDPLLLQRLQEKLNLIYSFPSAVIDNEGKILTAVAWQDICTKFHRTNPECEKECIKSDQYILEHLYEAKPAVSYLCPHGLIDNATPIVIDGKHLGNFFTGQFFLEKPDLDFFKTQARRYGFDEKEYLEAVLKVPVWTKEKLALYLDFIKGFIEIIAGLGLENLKLIETKKDLLISEERNREIIENSLAGYFFIDRSGIYQNVNSSWLKMHKYYSADEVIGKHFGITQVDKDLEKAQNIVDEVFLGNQMPAGEFSRLCKDGSIGYHTFSCNKVIKDEEVIGLEGFLIDITDRKKSEMIRQQSEEKYHMLFNNLITGFAFHEIILNEAGQPCDYRFLEVNPAFEKLTGLKADDLIGRTIKEVLPDSEEYWIETYGRVALYGSLVQFENYSRSLNRYYDVTAYSPEPKRFVTIFNDVTDRKQKELDLKISEGKFRTLFEKASDGIFLMNLNKDVKIVNESFARMHGYTVQEMSEMNLQKIDTPETYLFASERIKRILNGETLKFEVDHYDKQGKIVAQEVNATMIDIVGEKYILAFHRDITERKRSEEELRKRMNELTALNKELGKFSDANKELEQFAYVASHNLQEPLRTVSNYAKMFEEDYSDQIDEKALKYLHVINDATKRMTILLQSLLEFSRLGRHMKLSAVDCKLLINDVISDLDNMIVTSKARIIVGEMPLLYLYEAEIRQLFQNLIANGIKFGKKDTLPEIHIISERLEDKWKFSVSDNGIGIAPEYFKRIFEIFQRLHNMNEYEGSGIGLAYCKKIIQLHRGEIWVESTLGKGTTFHFTIPDSLA